MKNFRFTDEQGNDSTDSFGNRVTGEQGNGRTGEKGNKETRKQGNGGTREHCILTFLKKKRNNSLFNRVTLQQERECSCSS